MNTYFNLYIKWNREVKYFEYSSNIETLESAIALGREVLNSGDGCRASNFYITNTDQEVVYPKTTKTKSMDRKVYYCSFCGSRGEGKSRDYLVDPSPHLNADVALRPEGWSWDIAPSTFSDVWNCGCHKWNK